jgi:hypothetical protein
MKKVKNMPLLVSVGLFGINSKSTAYVYLFISLVLVIISVIMGMRNPIYFVGIGFLISAAWYFYCIKWVDKNSSW